MHYNYNDPFERNVKTMSIFNLVSYIPKSRT